MANPYTKRFARAIPLDFREIQSPTQVIRKQPYPETFGGLLGEIGSDALEKLDSYTGGPTRAALFDMFQERGEPVRAFREQLGETDVPAPTMATLAWRLGYLSPVKSQGLAHLPPICWPIGVILYLARAYFLWHL